MEIIQRIRYIEGTSEAHIMAYWQEEQVTEIVKESELLKRKLKLEYEITRAD